MSKGLYRAYGPEKNPLPEKMQLIAQASAIVREYEETGYTLTLRQLHYQFVTRNLYPNVKASYDKLGDAVSDGRLMGLISWTGIEDRTRNLTGVEKFDSVSHLLRSAKTAYRTDLWHNQHCRLEIWEEKEALAGVIEPVAHEEGVDFFACRGYSSQSEQWRAGRRFADYVKRGQRPIVIYLGDHDPSGLDMVEDHRRRLSLFAGVEITVVHLALTIEQIHRHSPPPNYAKKTDARYEKYRQKWGEHSWELDALPPDVLQRLVRDAIQRYRDEVRWSEALAEEAVDQERLEEMIEGLGESEG